MNAQKRFEAVQEAGLMETPINITRNGEAVHTLGRLVERDAAVEAKGCVRAPHGVEADALLAAGCLKPGAEIALDRAVSNGRNVFWGGGAVSAPDEVRSLGPEAARAAAFERLALWSAEAKSDLPAWAYTLTPDEFLATPYGRSLARERAAAAAIALQAEAQDISHGVWTDAGSLADCLERGEVTAEEAQAQLSELREQLDEAKAEEN